MYSCPLRRTAVFRLLLAAFHAVVLSSSLARAQTSVLDPGVFQGCVEIGGSNIQAGTMQAYSVPPAPSFSAQNPLGAVSGTCAPDARAYSLTTQAVEPATCTPIPYTVRAYNVVLSNGPNDADGVTFRQKSGTTCPNDQSCGPCSPTVVHFVEPDPWILDVDVINTNSECQGTLWSAYVNDSEVVSPGQDYTSGTSNGNTLGSCFSSSGGGPFECRRFDIPLLKDDAGTQGGTVPYSDPRFLVELRLTPEGASGIIYMTQTVGIGDVVDVNGTKRIHVTFERSVPCACATLEGNVDIRFPSSAPFNPSDTHVHSLINSGGPIAVVLDHNPDANPDIVRTPNGLSVPYSLPGITVDPPPTQYGHVPTAASAFEPPGHRTQITWPLSVYRSNGSPVPHAALLLQCPPSLYNFGLEVDAAFLTGTFPPLACMTNGTESRLGDVTDRYISVQGMNEGQNPDFSYKGSVSGLGVDRLRNPPPDNTYSLIMTAGTWNVTAETYFFKDIRSDPLGVHQYLTVYPYNRLVSIPEAGPRVLTRDFDRLDMSLFQVHLRVAGTGGLSEPSALASGEIRNTDGTVVGYYGAGANGDVTPGLFVPDGVVNLWLPPGPTVLTPSATLPDGSRTIFPPIAWTLGPCESVSCQTGSPRVDWEPLADTCVATTGEWSLSGSATDDPEGVQRVAYRLNHDPPGSGTTDGYTDLTLTPGPGSTSVTFSVDPAPVPFAIGPNLVELEVVDSTQPGNRCYNQRTVYRPTGVPPALTWSFDPPGSPTTQRSVKISGTAFEAAVNPIRLQSPVAVYVDGNTVLPGFVLVPNLAGSSYFGGTLDLLPGTHTVRVRLCDRCNQCIDVSHVIQIDDRPPLCNANATPPPLACDGGGQSAIRLSAGLSSDPDRDPLLFDWTMTSCPGFQIDNPAIATPTLTRIPGTPRADSCSSSCTVHLKVTDPYLMSDTCNRTLQFGIAVPQGMVGWWSFDESSGLNAADSTLTPHPGSLLPPGAPPVHVTGKVGNALLFRNTGDFVQVADAAGLNFGAAAPDGRTDFSIDAWVRVDAPAGAGLNVIVDKRASSPSNGYSLYLYDGRLGIQLADGPGDSGFTNFNSPTGGIANGCWRHVAATVDRDSASGGVLYVDGSPVMTFNPTGRSGSLVNPAPLWIGREAGSGSTSSFNGSIDEVKIFNRALSPGEVRSLYEAPPPSGLIGWWPGDGHAGDIVAGNNGILVNDVGFTPGPDDIVGRAFDLNATGTFCSLDGSRACTIDNNCGPQGVCVTGHCSLDATKECSGDIDCFEYGVCTGGHVRVPYAPALDPMSGSFSVDAWVKTSRTSGQSVVSKYDCGGTCSNETSLYMLYLENGLPKLEVRDQTPDPNTVHSGLILSGPTSIADGQWHLLVATRDIPDTANPTLGSSMNLYVCSQGPGCQRVATAALADGHCKNDPAILCSDNSACSTGACERDAEGVIGDGGAEKDPLIIGGVIYPGAALSHLPFKGEIDEVEIFRGQALTLGQITAIHQARNLGQCNVTGCLDADHDGAGLPGNALCPKGSPTDCDDSDSNTYPGAPEVNDGKDNQCSGGAGFGSIDEITGNSEFTITSGNPRLCWEPQTGAATYQIARSTRPDFSEACIVFTSSESCFTDLERPPRGGAFHYLIRPLTPHPGSWGRSSGGVERVVPCG